MLFQVKRIKHIHIHWDSVRTGARASQGGFYGTTGGCQGIAKQLLCGYLSVAMESRVIPGMFL